MANLNDKLGMETTRVVWKEERRKRTPDKMEKMQRVMEWLKENDIEAYQTIKNNSKKNMEEEKIHMLDKKLVESTRKRTPAEKKQMKRVMKWLKANNPKAYMTIKNKRKKKQKYENVINEVCDILRDCIKDYKSKTNHTDYEKGFAEGMYEILNCITGEMRTNGIEVNEKIENAIIELARAISSLK